MKKNVLVVVIGSFVLLLACLSFVPLTKSASTQLPAKPVIFTADVTYAQELYARPTTSPSTGVGAGVFVLSADRTKVSYAVVFTGTTGPLSASHLHGAGGYGQSVGVLKQICGPVCNEGQLYTGDWTTTDANSPLTQPAIDALLAGQVYFNAHTAANPGGEIRGQLVPVSAK